MHARSSCFCRNCATLQNAELPLTAYVHLPWCVQKCPYCDFNSHALRAELPEQRYLDALRADIAWEAERCAGRPIRSVFFGGGTPSLFSVEGIAAILHCLDDNIGLKRRAEITLEANPGTAEAQRFKGYREIGVNRLSIGVQSFDDDRLRVLGRIHSSSEARRALELAREAGFDNVNLDLMFGLPGQSTRDALSELAQAISLDVEHISWYQLTLEPNTRFAVQPPEDLPDPDALADMQQAGAEMLEEAGYQRYEVSAYARSGRACAHNLNYWRFGDYLGVGAGAHGKLTWLGGLVERLWKPRHPRVYQSDSSRVAERHAVGAEQLPFEFMLNALRLVEGVHADRFELATGLVFDDISAIWEALVAKQLVHPATDGRLRCSELGYRWLNDVVLAFLPR